jgi:iron(III) transport system permease protein
MTKTAPSRLQESLRRRVREFALIARDPVLMISLVFCGLFLFIFVVFPLFKGTINGFFDKDTGAFSLKFFERYFDSYYGPYNRWVYQNTLIMGISSAIGGTLLGFIFAYAMVRCSMPFKRFIHFLALVPTVSPPFALALSSVLLFGRNGLISHKLLAIEFTQGVNDIYGLDGLVFVQVISFFSVAYLIVRAMLERLDPSMEEAAHSLGAGKLHIFRTVTLPLLVPGIAGSFLLLFVESLADLGNPIFISGNQMVLSAQIWLAVVGEYDYQKASALAFALLIPTLVVFLVQRYYVTRRSYVSVTGKPTGGHIIEKEAWIRWPFIITTYAVCILIVVMYVAIVFGSFSTAWGVDFTPTLRWWEQTMARGIESILDTTFLSAVATPVAALTGMIIAFLVVRKNFSGKTVLDFASNLGGAVPGTILGIGFVLAFNLAPLGVVGIVFAVLALFLTWTVIKSTRERLLVLIGGTALALVFAALNEPLGELLLLYIYAGIFVVVGLAYWLVRKRKGAGWALMIMGLYIFASDWVEYLVAPLSAWTRSLERGFFANAVTQIPDYVQVFFKVPPPLLAIVYAIVLVVILERERGRALPLLAMLFVGLIGAMCFVGKPLAMVGTAYIIMFAFIVRSIPASVRAGVAALQQIDPSIEEASSMLGGDAQYTFRKVTLPLILPALLAGLIFSFTRHMTSLSAIIFLVSARWRIITATIMSEWEQGGISIAAAYMTVIIVVVLIAIALLYFLTGRMLRGRGDVDLTLGV